MSDDFQKHVDEAIANAGGDLCRLLEIAAASSSDALADDEHLAQNVLVLCERAAVAIKSLQKRSLMFMREREEARAELAAERERVLDLQQDVEDARHERNKLREALVMARDALASIDREAAPLLHQVEIRDAIGAILKETE